MENVTIVGVDLAKQVYQLHGAAADGSVVFRKRLTRTQFVRFMSEIPACIVAMEACATAHYWGREMSSLGHDIRLIPPTYVKPFVKRQKNDAADAEAIVEAAMRPTMRTVAVKTPEQQSRAMLFRTRELLVAQRTQLVNALRAHLAEHGVVVPKGLQNVRRLTEIVASEAERLPELVREMASLYLDRIEATTSQISALERRMNAEARRSDVARRLQTIPGIGPICAMAVETFGPPMQQFRRGRDFSAWLGLVPRQHSSGHRQCLGRTSKMGQRDIRRLLTLGAMSVVRWRGREGGRPGTWLARMLARKARLLVAIALANKMARMIWAMLVRGEDYRDPAGAVC